MPRAPMCFYMTGKGNLRNRRVCWAEALKGTGPKGTDPKENSFCLWNTAREKCQVLPVRWDKRPKLRHVTELASLWCELETPADGGLGMWSTGAGSYGHHATSSVTGTVRSVGDTGESNGKKACISQRLLIASNRNRLSNSSKTEFIERITSHRITRRL